MRSTSVRLPSSSSNSSGLARGHADEGVRAQVLEHEAALALARVEPLQRPAGAHARAHPELRRRPRGPRRPSPRPCPRAAARRAPPAGTRRAGLDQQRAAGLVGAAHALDHELDLAERAPAAVGDQRGARDPAAVDERAVRRADIDGERAVGPQLEPGVLRDTVRSASCRSLSGERPMVVVDPAGASRAVGQDELPPGGALVLLRRHAAHPSDRRSAGATGFPPIRRIRPRCRRRVRSSARRVVGGGLVGGRLAGLGRLLVGPVLGGLRLLGGGHAPAPRSGWRRRRAASA